MTFKLEINCDNAALEDLGDELEEILAEVILKYYAGQCKGFVRDSNGKTVGHFAFKGKRKE